MPATYPPSGQVTWVAGQRLDAADLNAWPPPRVAWGIVDSAEITSETSGITSEADVSGLTVTFTAVADRLYKVSFMGSLRSSVTNDRGNVYLTDGANTKIQTGPVGPLTATVTWGTMPWAIVEPGAGSATYKVRAERTTGSGTFTVFAASGRPSTILVEDIGPAS